MRKVGWIVGALAMGVVLELGVHRSRAGAAPADDAVEVRNELHAEATTPAAWPRGVAPELRRIQQELGGSAVDRFEALKETTGPAWATDHARSASDRRPSAADRQATGTRRPQVEALRDAAGQVDVLANRLEQLELYSQADALREQAQHMRLDARNMSGGNRPTSRASALPTPAHYSAPRLEPSQPPSSISDAWNSDSSPASRPVPSQPPGIIVSPPLEEPRPTPAVAPAISQPTPTITPTPSSPLEPTPLPENQQQPQSVEPTPLQE